MNKTAFEMVKEEKGVLLTFFLAIAYSFFIPPEEQSKVCVKLYQKYQINFEKQVKLKYSRVIIQRCFGSQYIHVCFIHKGRLCF